MIACYLRIRTKATIAGDWQKTVTKDVHCYQRSRDGATVSIWETSGLGNGAHVSEKRIIKELREGTTNEVDLCLFCIAYRKDVTVDDSHRNVIRLLTKEFGNRFWLVL